MSLPSGQLLLISIVKAELHSTPSCLIFLSPTHLIIEAGVKHDASMSLSWHGTTCNQALGLREHIMKGAVRVQNYTQPGWASLAALFFGFEPVVIA